MSRSVPEWQGKSDDEPIPARVKLRIFERAKGRCNICGLVLVGKLLPAYDHVQSLINGGANRESNLQLLCTECHKTKTGADVREKSVAYNKKVKWLKLKNKRKLIPGSKGSGFRKRLDGTVIREND